MENARAFLRMYEDLRSGRVVEPRGQKVKELEDYTLILDLSESLCTSFEKRKFSLPYAKAEVWWYLGGDRFDRSIDTKASMWPKLVQPDGSYFSQYGQYVFGEGQFEWVVQELERDPDSRRAAIVLLRKEHLFADNKDVVCTYAMNFRIRSGHLNMSVGMRSNDAVFGTSNDCFAFGIIHKMVLAALKYDGFPDLRPGRYAHKVDSLHVYERHWDMIDAIVAQGMGGYTEIEVPDVASRAELGFLLGLSKIGYSEPPPEFALATWLFNRPE